MSLSAEEILRQVEAAGGQVIADPNRPRLLAPSALRSLVNSHREALRALVLERAFCEAADRSPLPAKALQVDAMLPKAAGPWRVMVLRRTTVAAPVQLNRWAKILDPARCAEAALADLEIAVAHKNTGRETAFTRLIEEYMETLRACGVSVVVESVC